MQPSEYVIANESSWISGSDLPAIVGAAEKGDSHAAFRLGRYYANLTTDKKNALRFYGMAASSGHTQAMYNLGFILLASEQQTEKQEGINWLMAAKAKGDKEADELLRLNGFE